MTKPYPEIERLAEAVRQHGLLFVVEPPAVEFSPFYYRHVLMRAGDSSWRVPVEDEENDIEGANPVWLLHRVLHECYWFETSADYLVWSKDLGLKADSRAVREVYFQLRDVSPQIATLLGADVHCLPEYDVVNNTASMQKLRAYHWID